jgi:hypothetical protein
MFINSRVPLPFFVLALAILAAPVAAQNTVGRSSRPSSPNSHLRRQGSSATCAPQRRRATQ